MSFHFAWRLLYNKFSFLFDFASTRVSGGRWRLWGHTCMAYVQGQRILELGHGPGHLLPELKRAGHQPVGIDLSPGMGRLAKRRLTFAGMHVPLVRCRAQTLPFRPNSFDAAVATFPTNDMLELNTLQEVARVIPQGGKLIMVVGAQRDSAQPNPQFIEWLRGVIGEQSAENGQASNFPRSGFRPRIECPMVEGSPVILLIAEKRQREDGRVNLLPRVDLPANVRILTKDQPHTLLKASATDPDGDPLTYRWLNGQIAFTDRKPVNRNGDLYLELQNLPPLEIGRHALTLEVSDPYETVVDTVDITVENSPPMVQPLQNGIHEVGRPIRVRAYVSDYDGDVLNYSWLKEGTVLASGSVQTLKRGEPIDLTSDLGDLPLGHHLLRFEVSDGWHAPVSADTEIRVADTTPPRLAPVVDRPLLWPPDHSMTRIIIQTNASDNSGLPVRLSACVSSNEPETGLGEWDVGPDWKVEKIDEATGIIALQLRAERSERGMGRRYTVAITAIDHAGNVATDRAEILVPRDPADASGSRQLDSGARA